MATYSDDYRKLSGRKRKELRKELLEIYGYQCWWCKKPITLETSHYEHLIPRSKGGTTRIANGRPSCPECNLSRGNGDKHKKQSVKTVNGLAFFLRGTP